MSSAAIGERGDGDLDDGEAAVEILAESPLRDPVAQIAVGGGDNAHIDWLGLR